jgi:hypothetical protein
LADIDINRYLEPCAIHLICGRSGVGKTHVLYQVLDRFRDKLGSLLYLATDRASKSYQDYFDKGDIAEFPLISLIDAGAKEINAETDDQAKNKVASKHVRDSKDNTLNWEWVRAMYLKHNKPDTLVIDIAQHVVPVDNMNSSAAVARGMSCIARFVKAFGIRLILVWHPNKTLRGKLNDPFDLIAHSHSIQGVVSTKVLLEHVSVNKYTMSVRGQNFKDQVIHLSKHDEDQGFFRVENDESRLKELYPIYQHIGTDPIVFKDIKKAAESDPKCAASSKGSIQNHLRKLMDNNMIEKTTHGLYRRKITS